MTTGSFACAMKAWHEHQREIKGYLAHRLSDSTLADDLLQDVFLQAMRQGAAFCRIDNSRAWLFQVARNSVVDHLRRAKHQVPLPDDLADETEPPAPVDELVGCMARVLNELSEEDAEVIRECDLEGVKLQTYAASHGLSLPAVKSRVQRARIRMRELLTRNCQVNFDDAGRVCCHVPRLPA